MILALLVAVAHPIAAAGVSPAEACIATPAAAADGWPPPPPQLLSTATFACGCFWGAQLRFDRVPGVIRTVVGYTAGLTAAPTYREVSTGTSGHAEAVEVTYNAAVVSYTELLDVFFAWHDPTTLSRQKNDIGSQYRSGIYTHTEEQRAQAEASIAAHASSFPGRPIVTEVQRASIFFLAEEYHQQYLQKGGQDPSKGATAKIRCYG